MEGTNDPKRIYVADISDWDVIEQYDSFIEILAPGSMTPVTFPFEKGGMSTITAVTLGIQGPNTAVENLVNIPDGIYRIKVYGTPNSYYKEKAFLKADQFQIRYDQILLSTLGNCTVASSYDKELFIEIRVLMLAAMANVRLGNDCEAEKLYNEAYKLLKKINCNGLLCKEP